ncbi:MAG: YihY/virulence factor BrkB family protein [Acidobacteriota bacterium]|nr:YihY/virulence factor BrkB family protein [Acidobacteriota bacterium]
MLPASQPKPAAARALHQNIWPMTCYLFSADARTYAFSVAALAILSFFPFVLVLLTVTKNVLHSQVMYDVVLQLLRDYLPASQDFVIRNLNVLVEARRRAQILSLLILLVTSTGVFLPLEVALNRVWGFTAHRSFLRNLLISFGLDFASGLLALASVALTAGNQLLFQSMTGGEHGPLVRSSTFVVMKISAVAASIAIFFLIYWLLPNGKIPARSVLLAAAVVGVLWEAAKYLYIWSLPWLNFREVYGPFAVTVTLMIWAFLSGLLLLAGAHLTAAGHREPLP